MSQSPRKPRRWTPEAVDEHVAWSRDELNALTLLIAEVFERHACDSDNGYRSPAGGEGRGGKYGDDGANNGPVPRAAVRGKPDSVSIRFQAFLNGVPALSSLVQTLAGHARFLVAMDHDAARELVEQAKPQRAAPCANCERMVENTPNDPIRSGRCGACWQWRRRHDGEERPKDQWENNAA